LFAFDFSKGTSILLFLWIFISCLYNIDNYLFTNNNSSLLFSFMCWSNDDEFY